MKKNKINNNSYKFGKVKMHISLKHVLEKTNSITEIIITLQNEDSMFQFYLKLVLVSLVSWFIRFSRNRFLLLFGGFLSRYSN